MIRRRLVKFNTNILTNNTHLQRVEWTQALEGIRSNLRDLVVAEVSGNTAKHRVIREKELQRMRKKQRKSNWLGHLTIALTLCTHSLAPLKHLYSIWSDFCWQARGIFGAPSLHSFTWLPTESCAWVGWGCICPRHGFWLAQPVCPMLEWWGEILQRRRAFPSYWNAVEQTPQVHGPLSKPQWAFFALWAS